MLAAIDIAPATSPPTPAITMTLQSDSVWYGVRLNGGTGRTAKLKGI